MIPFFNALITSRHAVELCSPWVNTQKPRLSKLMSRTWQDLAKRLGDLPGNRNVDVAELPTAKEARRVGEVLLTTDLYL